jgi:hypothetical protein
MILWNLKTSGRSHFSMTCKLQRAEEVPLSIRVSSESLLYAGAAGTISVPDSLSFYFSYQRDEALLQSILACFCGLTWWALARNTVSPVILHVAYQNFRRSCAFVVDVIFDLIRCRWHFFVEIYWLSLTRDLRSVHGVRFITVVEKVSGCPDMADGFRDLGAILKVAEFKIYPALDPLSIQGMSFQRLWPIFRENTEILIPSGFLLRLTNRIALQRVARRRHQRQKSIVLVSPALMLFNGFKTRAVNDYWVKPNLQTLSVLFDSDFSGKISFNLDV